MEVFRSLRRNTDLPFQTLAGQVVIVDPKASRVHVLNGTASRIWELLGQDMDHARLIDTLNDEYDLDSPERMQEVESFLRELEELGLVVLEREPDVHHKMR